MQNIVAQSNLVINPSFEHSYASCFPSLAGFDFGQVDNWSSSNHSTPDYFLPISWNGSVCSPFGNTSPPNNVFGYEYAHTGECYGGFAFYDYSHLPTFYEYIQAEFKDSLVAGKTYALEAYVSLGFEGQCLCISNLGFYFSDTQVSVSNASQRLNYIPQFENPVSNPIITFKGWQKINGDYTAHGGEKYMTIGMFKPYSMANVDTCYIYSDLISYTYLFIDDVAVYDTAQIDTIHLCINDSVLLGGAWQHAAGLYTDTIGGLPVKFYIEPRPDSVNLTIIDMPFASGDSVKAGYIWVKNDTIIEVPKHNIYGCDSLVRYLCRTNVGISNPESTKDKQWNIYPNPANDFLQITINKNYPKNYSISIINITGKEIISQSLSKETIDISSLNSGMYFVRLINSKTGNVQGTMKFVKE